MEIPVERYADWYREMRMETPTPRDPYRDFSGPALEALAACQAEIASYPVCLRHAGLAYFRKLKLAGRGRRIQSLTVLLPFWLNDIFGLNPDSLAVLVKASAYTLLYLVTEDELMDEPASDAARTELAALSCMFFSGMIRHYRTCFDSGSPFWVHLDRYIGQWGDSVLWERRGHWGQPAPYRKRDLLRVARKAAPLKLPGAAMSLLCLKPELIVTLDAMLDEVTVAFQMLDDLRDWRTDLANRNFSYFLTRIVYAEPSPRELDAEAVEIAVFGGEAVDAVLDLALKYDRKALKRIANLDAGYLRLFIELQCRRCDAIKDRLNRKRGRLLAAALRGIHGGPPSGAAQLNESS